MINKYFTIKNNVTPKNKFRGRKRYYKHLSKSSRMWVNSLTENDFQFSWYIHFFSIHGTYNIKDRIQHLKNNLNTFNLLINKINLPNEAYQLWIELHEWDPNCEVIHFSTKTDNGKYLEFPYKPEIKFGITDFEIFLNRLSPSHTLKIGCNPIYMNDKIHERCYLVFSENHGETLENF